MLYIVLIYKQNNKSYLADPYSPVRQIEFFACMLMFAKIYKIEIFPTTHFIVSVWALQCFNLSMSGQLESVVTLK